MALGKFAVDYEQRVDYPRLRAERLQRAKEQINKAGLGAVVTWDEANVRYLTGYYITTPNRPLEAQFAFVARNGEPHIIGGNDQEGLIKRMPWMGGRIHAPAGIAKIAAFTPDDPVVQNVVNQIYRLHGAVRRGEGAPGYRRHHPVVHLCRGLQEAGHRGRPRQAHHGLRPHDQDRGRDRADAHHLRQLREGLRGHRRRHPPGHPGVRPGGHRHQGSLRRRRRPHRGPGVLLGPQHQPLRLVLHRQARAGGRPRLHRCGRSLLPGLQVLRLPHVLLRQGQPGAEGRLRGVPGHALRRHRHQSRTAPPTGSCSTSGPIRPRTGATTPGPRWVPTPSATVWASPCTTGPSSTA